MVQFGLFVSPIAYTTANVPDRWRLAFLLNPMVGIIDGFRWCLLRGYPPLDVRAAAIAVVVTSSFLLLGLWYFRRMERGFADVI
jgi:lipopolysaccharide transport system permease protein